MTNRPLIINLLLSIILGVNGFGANQKESSAAQLIENFNNTHVFWQQFEIAKRIVALGDIHVLDKLESWLIHQDRHLRGNAAYIFARLGNDRGFKTILEILNDRSNRPLGPGVRSLSEQIKDDRYYAAHLFGDLRDPKAVPILIPLLNDEDVSYIIPWSLAEIGDKRAIAPLIDNLKNRNPSLRVLSIYALEKLNAREALPRLHELLQDEEKSNFGDLVTVAVAAKAAIAKLDTKSKSEEDLWRIIQRQISGR
jgi:HEAT repeat protein